MRCKKRLLFLFVAVALMLIGWNHPLEAAFFSGKTITVIVNAGAGGGLTRSCQVFVKHMPKHVPGNPKIIIKNLPGSAGIKGLNYLAEKARPDGKTILWGPSHQMAKLTGMAGVRFDPEKFRILGAGNSTFVTLMRADTPPGIKTPADVVKASGFKVGGRGPTSPLDLFARTPLHVMDVKYIYVPGYRAQPKMNAAIRGKEIQYLTTGHQGYRAFYEKTILKTGEAIALYYHSPLDINGNPTRVDYYPSNLRHFVDVYRDIYGKDPSGPMWEAYKWISTYGIWPFQMLAPDGTPDEAVADLRKAHEATTKDPDYQKDYIKQFGNLKGWMTGKEAEWLLTDYKNISPAGLEGLRSMLKK